MKRKATKEPGRPTIPENEKVVSISVTLPSKHLEALESLSRMRRWSRARAAGYLIEIGLQAQSDVHALKEAM